jgi:putative transposase
MTRLRHYDNLGTARLVTFSCYRRMSNLSERRAKEIFIDCLRAAREKHDFKLSGYVVMPDHVHLVIHPPDVMRLGLVVREIKSKMARAYFGEMPTGLTTASRVFWQKRCYDHNCRSAETVREKIEYCHKNPVKRGLVEEPGDWEWSSYNYYEGKSSVPLSMDRLEL